MSIFTLIVLLLTVPMVDHVPDDDPEDEPEESVVFLTVPATTNHFQPAAMRYMPNYQTLFRPQARGNIQTSLGYMHVNAFFDDQGDRHDFLDLAQGGELNAISWNITGSYDAVTIRDLRVRLGAGLSMYQREISGTVDLDESSGFAPQNMSVFSELLKPNWSFRTGFFYDFKRGQEPDPETENSDGAHAIHFAVHSEYPVQQFRLFGGAEYFVTLRGRTFDPLAADHPDFPSRPEYAPGDIVHLTGGGGLRLGQTIEAGAALLFRFNREGQYAGIRGSELGEVNLSPSVAIQDGAPNEFDSGYVLSIAPYVNYAPTELPLQFYLKGAVQREYHDYGFAIIGENEIAPALVATFGLVYDL